MTVIVNIYDITGRAKAFSRQATLSAEQYNPHVRRCRVFVDGMDRLQWWLSIIGWLYHGSSYPEYPYLHCHQPFGVALTRYDCLQEEFCHRCGAGNDHRACLHHSGSR